MITSIIIARSSADRHDVSCKSQITEIKSELLKRNERIFKVLEFPRKKHSDFLEDPDFRDILSEAKIKDRKWNKIWFYDTARLSRNRLKAQTTKAFFRKHGIEIEFLKIPKTGEEALDNVVEGILETFDQLLSDFCRAGSIRGQKQNIRSGYRAGGPAPFGYRLKKHKIGINADKEEITKSTLEPHPQNFPIVKEYLFRRSEGESRSSIILDFKQRKIKSPSGNPYWQASTCNSIENNILVYCGHLVYNRHNKKIEGKYIGGKKFRPEDEWEVTKNCHKPAISEEQAETIKAQIIKRKSHNPQARKYLLTGILKCGICKGPMVGDSGFYTCIHKRKHITDCNNNNIKAGYIDQQSIRFVKDILLSKIHFENIIEETRKAYRQEISVSQKDNSRIESQIKEIDIQIGRLMSLFERGTVSSDIIEDRITRLEKEKFEFSEYLENNNLISEAIRIAESELDQTIVREYINQFESLLDDLNKDLMRQFIQNFIHKIELGRNHKYKKRSRKVNIYATIPAFARMNLVLPRGLEPLLPA